MPGRCLALLLLAAFAAVPSAAFAGHPLGTEDPGVLGTGNVEVELNFERDHFRGDARGTAVGAVATVGVAPRIDLLLSSAYLFAGDPEASPSSVRGMGDTEIDVKARLAERKGLRPALGAKAGVKLPTADHEKGSGTGAADGLFTAIAGWEGGPLNVFLNAKYTLAGRSLIDRSRNDALLGSLACEYEVRDKASLVGEYVWEKNVGAGKRASRSALAGGKYEIAKNVVLDAGIRWGLSGTAADVAYLAGATLSFPARPDAMPPESASH